MHHCYSSQVAGMQLTHTQTVYNVPQESRLIRLKESTLTQSNTKISKQKVVSHFCLRWCTIHASSIRCFVNGKSCQKKRSFFRPFSHKHNWLINLIINQRCIGVKKLIINFFFKLQIRILRHPEYTLMFMGIRILIYSWRTINNRFIYSDTRSLWHASSDGLYYINNTPGALYGTQKSDI